MPFIPWPTVPHVPDGLVGARVIYALIDPRDETVRYVGVTSDWPEKRLRNHLLKPTNKKMRLWIQVLAASELIPQVRVLSVPTFDWESSERGWIAWFRQRGDLLNVDPGGICRKKGKPLPGVYPPSARRSKRPALPRQKQDPCGAYLKARESQRQQNPGSVDPIVRRRKR